MAQKIGVGLYGDRGHQVTRLLVDHPKAELIAVAAFESKPLPDKLHEGVRRCESLDELLRDDAVQLVSLCSPRRRDQAREAIRCLEAGKHVYAEKPCAMTEADLDAIMRTSRETGHRFHEMAGTSQAQPYYAMRKIVRSGVLGTIIQVFAQKSYPYHDRRPQDEDLDGGLILQAGVHAFRMIEHVACQRIADVTAMETALGNPVAGGGLRMASGCLMRLEGGGVASVIANYLNPKGTGIHGYESLRIFGANGFVESLEGGRRTRLVVGDEDRGAIDVSESVPDYFNQYVDSLLGSSEMPFTMDEELHPTRMVIRAKESAVEDGHESNSRAD
jgi:predicted dehydrogenase